jgi:acyl carrier protein
MQLDADLGIDSIKRVEILAALQERLPEAPVIGPEHLGTIRTLGQIVDFLAGTATNGVAPVAVPVAPASTPAIAIQEALIAVVSEKTGYPSEVLEPSMQLDADLGIDSIKRVEILAALQERLPEAPVIGPEHLGTIRTLGQIVEFLAGGAGITPSASPLAASQPRPAPPAASVRRYVPTIVPLDPGVAYEPALGGEAWVLDDGSPLAAEIVTALERRGLRALAIQPGSTSSSSGPLEALVLPGSLGSLEAFRLLRAAAPGLKRAGLEGRGAVATVTQLGGSFGIAGLSPSANPESGGLAGLAKTVGQEWPGVLGKAIDLEPGGDPTETAKAVVSELFTRGAAEVGITRQARTTIALHAAAVGPAGSAPLEPGDVVVVSGGARGVTADVAEALGAALRPTLVLLGRSPAPEAEPDWLAQLADEAAIKRALIERAGGKVAPAAVGDQARAILQNREALENLRRIEATGARVVYRSLDVRDRGAVAVALGSIRQEFGPIRGLIHGAGVLADRRIEDQTDDQFQGVYETKVRGLDHLLAAVGDDLRVLVLFSSTTARLGRAGQVAYAAANEVLNKRAQVEARARPGCRVVSVNWGPWAGGMVTPALRPIFESEGIPLIDPQAGASYLVDEIRSSLPSPVEVVILGGGGPEPEFLKPTARATEAAEPALTRVFERVVDLASTPILADHVLDGRPVLPMALILEWLAQGALHRHPGMALGGLEELRLLKGVVVREGKAEEIRILAGKPTRRDDGLVVPVELRGDLGEGRDVVHARASVVLVDRLPAAPSPFDEPALPPLGATREEIYRDVLFHGAGLQGIEAVEGCGELGIVASVATSPAPSRWVEKPLRQAWLADPLALDCAFQLMIVWSVERSGSGSLPTRVGRYRQFRRAFPAEGVRVVARVLEASPHRARADVDFVDGSGHLVARIEDYECVIDASLASAFRRNRVVSSEAQSRGLG